MKIVDKSSVYIETSLFKKRGKLTEDFFTDVIIESFKNATKLTEKTFLLMMKQIETLDLSFERITKNWDL